MSTTIPASTVSQSAATSTTLTHGSQPTTVIAGEQNASVTVQSQLATSTVAGQGVSNSNLSQVVNDLGAAHTAHSGWAEAESLKVNEWGNKEIARLMEQTKGVEQRLVAEAQGQQKLLEDAHKVRLSKMVQELDVEKAKQLKELEDSLQRQIQAALTQSKNDINGIETEMNNRKMALLQQQQLRAAKDVDRLSNLAFEAKLVPSVTRTVIETNTETGTVIAVAAGGQISTGQASSQTIASKSIEAVPAAGTLSQATDVRTGDIVTNQGNRKVGEGAIVNTMTTVTQAKQEGETMNHSNANLNNPTNMPAGTVHADNKHIDAAYGKPLHHDASAAKAAVDPAFNKHDTTDAHHKEGLLEKVKHAITGEPKSSDATKRVQ